MVDILIPAAMLLLGVLSAWSVWKAWLEPRLTARPEGKPRGDANAALRERAPETEPVPPPGQLHSTAPAEPPVAAISQRRLSSQFAGGLLVLGGLSLVQCFTGPDLTSDAASQNRVGAIAWAVTIVVGGLLTVFGPGRSASRTNPLSEEERDDSSLEGRPRR